MPDPQHKFMIAAEYARARGLTPGRVSQMKAEGKLVLSLDGLIDVEQTDTLLSLTADSRGRPRGGADRKEAGAVAAALDTAKNRKEFYLAENARLDYEERCGRLLVAAEVRKSIADAATTLRVALEALPPRLAPGLAGKDEAHIQAVLTEHIEMVLKELAHKFTQSAKAPRRHTPAA